MSGVTLSIVIITWRMKEQVLRCLDSIGAAALSREVIVVVNSNEDGTAEAVAVAYPTATVLVNEKNIGVAPARVQGMQRARGRYVLLLDADTVVPLGALEALVAHMEADSSIGVGGAPLLNPEGALSASARNFPTLPSKLRRRAPRAIARFLPSDEVVLSGPTDVDYVIGACQCIRREALADTGPLDERIFYGPEDVDLCLRMWKSGWRVVWTDTIPIIHEEQRITKKRALSRLAMRNAVAHVYYFAKHRYLWRRPSRTGTRARRRGSSPGLAPG